MHLSLLCELLRTPPKLDWHGVIFTTTTTTILIRADQPETATGTSHHVGIRGEDQTIEATGTGMNGEEEIRGEEEVEGEVRAEDEDEVEDKNEENRDPNPLIDRNQNSRKSRKLHKPISIFSAKSP